jgi:hypothetical protein
MGKGSKYPHPGSLSLADPPHKGEGRRRCYSDSFPRKRGDVNKAATARGRD